MCRPLLASVAAEVRRRRYFGLIVIGIVIFIAISALLARIFSVDGAEQGAITDLVQAEAAGNTTSMLDEIQGCRTSPACRARVAHNVAALAHSGKVSILQLNTSAGFSLTSTLGTARVAWEAGSSLPIVQCVRVRHAGNAITGMHVELLELSERINSGSDCPTHF